MSTLVPVEDFLGHLPEHQRAVLLCVRELVNVHGHARNLKYMQLEDIMSKYNLGSMNIPPLKLKNWMNGRYRWLRRHLSRQEFDTMRWFWDWDVVPFPVNPDYDPHRLSDSRSDMLLYNWVPVPIAAE